jgi:hypothetical protein
VNHLPENDANLVDPMLRYCLGGRINRSSRQGGTGLSTRHALNHTIADENPALVLGLVAEVIAAVRDPSTWAAPAASTRPSS